jgi:hypothetical protein
MLSNKLAIINVLVVVHDQIIFTTYLNHEIVRFEMQLAINFNFIKYF